MIAFGPVSSRRLELSLGINNIVSRMVVISIDGWSGDPNFLWLISIKSFCLKLNWFQ